MKESFNTCFAPYAIPNQLRLDVSRACGIHCAFCPFHGDWQPREEVMYLPLPYYQRLVADLAVQNLRLRVRFVGSGEPTTYPWFKQLARELYGNGHRLKIVTNGQYSSAIADTLIDAFEEVVFSVHGQESVHDELTRHAGAFNKLMTNVQLLRARGYPGALRLHMVITAQNAHQLDAHASMAADLGVVAQFQHMYWRPEGSGLDEMDLDRLKLTLRNIKEGYPHFKVIPDLSDDEMTAYYDFSKVFRRDVFRCTKLFHDIGIRYDGDVSVCGGPSLGNIKTDGIISLLTGQKRTQFIEGVLSSAPKPEGPPAACSRCCHN